MGIGAGKRDVPGWFVRLVGVRATEFESVEDYGIGRYMVTGT